MKQCVLEQVALSTFPIVLLEKAAPAVQFNPAKERHASSVIVEANAVCEFSKMAGMTSKLEDSSALVRAIERDDLQLLRTLLLNGCDSINEKSSYALGQSTPLHVALYKNNYAAVEALLLAGCLKSIFTTDSFEYTPISYAIWIKNNEIVELLLINAGCIKVKKQLFDSTSERIRSVMTLMDGAMKIKKKLSENNMSTEQLNYCDINKIVTLIQNADSEGVRNFILSVKGMASLRHQDSLGLTALHHAINFGNIEIVKILLIGGAMQSMFTQDNTGVTPFDLALRKNHKKIIILLCLAEAGRYPFKSALAKIKALSLAIEEGNVEKVKFFLIAGGNFLTSSRSGKTALYVAVMSNDIQMVRSLVKRGANINAKDDKNQTPLHVAAAYAQNDSHLKMVQELLVLGADASAKDVTQTTAESYLNNQICNFNPNTIKVFLTHKSENFNK